MLLQEWTYLQSTWLQTSTPGTSVCGWVQPQREACRSAFPALGKQPSLLAGRARQERAHSLRRPQHTSQGATRAAQVAEELTAKDVIRAHARDELGIDMDDLARPLQAAGASAFAFVVGAALPLLAGAFLRDYIKRLLVIAAVSTVGLAAFGITGAALGPGSAGLQQWWPLSQWLCCIAPRPAARQVVLAWPVAPLLLLLLGNICCCRC